MSNPFQGPRFAKVASENIEELRPLLAADGFDLENLGPDVNLDDLNTSLSRATERHNLAVSTPVGADRTATLRFLSEFTQLLDDRSTQEAIALLGQVGPYASAQQPASGHVIGTSLSLLDGWISAERPFHVYFLPFPSYGRKVAIDVLAAAEDGEAFDAMNDLIIAYGGEALMHGAALAVASYLACAAKAAEVTTAELSARLLAPRAGTAEGGRRPAPTRATTKRGSRERRLLRTFKGWLEVTGEVTAAQLEMLLIDFEVLLDFAADESLDLYKPEHTRELWSTIEAESLAGEEDAATLLDVLAIYIDFRASGTTNTDAWRELQLELDPPPGSDGDSVDDLLKLGISQLHDKATSRAMDGLPIYSQLPALLAWIGEGRQVTGSGDIRRADLASTAALLGISAIGVSKRPPRGSTDGTTIHALNMRDIPLLTDWWEAAVTMGLIRLTATRAYLGPSASTFQEDPREIGTLTVLTMLAYMLLPHPSGQLAFEMPVTISAFELLLDALRRALHGEESTATVDVPPQAEQALAGQSDDLLKRLADGRIDRLARLGIVERVGDDWKIRPGLAPIVAGALRFTRDQMPNFF